MRSKTKRVCLITGVMMVIAAIIASFFINTKKTSIQGIEVATDQQGYFNNNYAGYYVKAVSAASDLYKIYPRLNGNETSTVSTNAGWCLYHHGTLNGYKGARPFTKLVSISDARGYSNIPDFILYNLIRTCEGGTSSYITSDEINFYKKRLGITEYNDADAIFAAEQQIIWHYTNGENSYTGNTIANKIMAMYNSHTNYSLEKENAINIVAKDTSKNDAENNRFGLFHLTNETGLYVDLKVSISTDGRNYRNISNYTAYKADGTKINDFSTYNGDFYIETSEANKTPATLKIELVHYITTAKYWTTVGENTSVAHQPVLYIDREKKSITAQTKTEKKITGSYNLYVAKKDKDNPNGPSLIDAGFNISRRLNCGSNTDYAYQRATTDVKSKGWSPVPENVYHTHSTDKDLVAEKINITDTRNDDIYTIQEVEAPAGYEMIQDSWRWRLGFNVKKEVVGDHYEVTQVLVKAGTGTIATLNSSKKSAIIGSNCEEITDPSNYNDRVVKFEYDAGSVTVTWYDKKIEGSYNLKIVKKSERDYTVITNKDNIDLADKTNALAGAMFSLTQQVRENDELSTEKEVMVQTRAGTASTAFGNVPIYLNGIGAGKYDRYTITEFAAPNGYKKANLDGLSLTIYKKRDGNKYVIDYARINNARGNRIGENVYSGQNQDQKHKEVIDIDGNGKWDLGLEVSEDGTTIEVTVINEHEDDTFKINLVKYLKDTTQKLPGAKFDVKVEKTENGTVVGNPIYQGEQTTDANGEINIEGIVIQGPSDTYKVTLVETKAPDGYIAIDGPITFNVSTTKEGDTYKLAQQGNITVANAKKVEVKANEILIEAEDRTTSIDIHKGVKTVENQDSGYYAEPDVTYIDETTGNQYTEIQLEELQHKWVIETTIPEDVSNYKKYAVTDQVDLSKLNFSGLGRVVVQRINAQGNVIETLARGTDYQASYVPASGLLTVTYINKKDGNTFIGAFLKEAGVQNRPGIENTKLRITFNTTFKRNADGKLNVLVGSVVNAQNQAKLSYDNGNGTVVYKLSETPEVHTGAVSVFKYEDENGNGIHDAGEKALVGAEFKIALTEEDAIAKKFIKVNGKELVAVTNKHGIATFDGLSFGGDASDDEANLANGLYNYDWENASRKYYIVETKTPLGYRLLNDVFEVTISKNSSEIIDLTDKIEEMKPIGNTPLEFDLALRKFIYSVENEDGITHPDPARGPSLNIFSVVNWRKNGTLGYFHTKQAVPVQYGDVITYRIYVFNEAFLDGYATEITDYLQNGLEYIADSEVNIANGWTATVNADGTTTLKTNKLSSTLLSKYPGQAAMGTTDWNAYVEVQCRVNKDPSDKVIYLTNRAEITGDKAVDYDEGGNEVELDIEDRDSQPNNVKKYHNKDMLDYDSTKEYTTNEHYQGYQDDDDKETVFISPKNEYKFNLIKVDDRGDRLNGSKFTIEKELNGGFVSVFGGVNGAVVNGSTTINENTLENNVKFNKTYTYKIKETEVKAGYENVLDGKYIIVKTYMDEDRHMVQGVYGDNNENSYFKLYGFEIYNNDGTLVSSESTNLYERITITTKNNVYPPEISITIPNDRIITGQYKIDLKKVDSSNNALGGMSFMVNGVKKVTDNTTGLIGVTDEKEEANGYVAINKQNAGTVDTYTLKEVEGTTPTGYILIKDPITLNVSKGLNASGDDYIVTKINVAYTNKIGQQSKDINVNTSTRKASAQIPVLTEDGDLVNVNINVNSDGTITVKATNNKKDGEYSLQIYKVDEEENPVSEVSFQVSGEASALVTGEDGYTSKITKKITSQNVSTTDEYTVKELPDAKGRLIPLKNAIKVTITKAENESGYKLNTVKISEENTSNETAAVTAGNVATLSGVKLADSTGRTVNVKAEISSNNTVVLTVENKEIISKIDLKIKKVNSINNENLAGVQFSVKEGENAPHTVTTDENGIAYIENQRAVSSIETLKYLITELSIPDELGSMVTLTDFGIELTAKTKFNSVNNEYIIDSNSVVARVKELGNTVAANEHERQRQLAQKAVASVSVNGDGTELVITMYNEPKFDYNFRLAKVQVEDHAPITGAKFTIIEDGVTIKNNEYLGASADATNMIVRSKSNILANSTHTYDIYETQAAIGYVNILENTFIRVTINVDSEGVATASYEIKKQIGATDADVAKVNQCIQEHKNNTGVDFLISENNNKFLLNLPNPKETSSALVRLKKHQLGDTSKGVSGAHFTVRKAKIDADYRVELSAAMNAFDTNTGVDELSEIVTYSSQEYINIDRIEDVEVGSVYYYEITESTVPANFKSKFKKALVRVKINTDKTVTAEIKVVNTDGGVSWIPYDEDTDQVDMSASVDGTTVNLSWANSTDFTLNLTKLSYDNSLPKDSNGKTAWGAMTTLSGANFKITPVSPVVETPLVDGVISSVEVYHIDNVNTNSTYVYKIEEIAAPAGYYNTFDKMDIMLTVRTAENGTIKSATIKAQAKDGETVSEADIEKANTCLGTIIDNTTRTVNIKIANKRIINDFNIKIYKTSDQLSPDGKQLGIPNVKFIVKNPLNVPIVNDYTDEDGYLTVGGIVPSGHRDLYQITETEAPAGIVMLSSPIGVWIDTTGISSTDSPEVIAQKLSELVDTDSDGVGDASRFEIVYSAADRPAGLSVTADGTDVVITIPNESKTYNFNFSKLDIVGNLIGTDANGIGPIFSITYENNEQEIVNGILQTGYVTDHRACLPDTTYEYTIKEISSKVGHTNILQGYELHLFIETDSTGLVKVYNDNDVSGTHYTLIRTGEERLYDESEIEELVVLSVVRNLKSSSVSLAVKNPYQYGLMISKHNSDGSAYVQNVSMMAEKIEGANITDLYGPSGDKSAILSEIAASTNVSKVISSSNQSMYISNYYRIDNNIGMSAKSESAHMWRIKEISVDAPYTNVLENCSIVVATYYRNDALNMATHMALNETGTPTSYNYYILDEDGNDVTVEYSKYVDVSINKYLGEWNLCVDIKDPCKFYVALNKYSKDEPLSGATLSMTVGEQTKEIKDGSTTTGDVLVEIEEGRTATVVVRETATVNGYRNILEGVRLQYVIKNENGNMKVIMAMLIRDDGSNEQITGEEYTNIIKYITRRTVVTPEGYQKFEIYIENPLSYEFELEKDDISGNLLNGTQIEVVSSHSGTHYIDGASSLSFEEKDVDPDEEITYTIKEINTVNNSAYLNKFNNPIQIKAVVNNGNVSVASIKQKNGATYEDVSDLDYFNCSVTPTNASSLASGEKQKLQVKLQNPPQIAVELLKTTAGTGARPIQNTKFTIKDQEDHTALTNASGKINYTEEISTPGRYTIRVYEDEVANAKYINVLENKYMSIDIDVAADGTISIPTAPKFYVKDADNDYTNDVLVDSETEATLSSYCSATANNADIISKLEIVVKDPVKYDIAIRKEDTNGTAIEGAKFNITSPSKGTEEKQTANNGEVSITEDWIVPGVYKYEITETETVGKQYDNILDGHKLVAYVKIAENGTASLVANASGSAFTNTANNQKYLVKKADNTDAEAEDEALIREFCKIQIDTSGDVNEVKFIVVNPVNQKINIIKNQISDDGVSEEKLDNTMFTVYKNGTELLLNRVIVTEATELEEHNLSKGNSYYDIYEDQTANHGSYVNILKGKFIRVYTGISADGVLSIKDSDENNSANYFEVYEVKRNSDPELLDRAENAKLYNSISVNASKDADNVYTLNVKVINPITIDVGFIKKQCGVDGANISNVSATIVSGISGKHDITTNNRETEFSEENIKPGTYEFIVKENDNPNPKYVNILKNRYAKVSVTISKTGIISTGAMSYYADNGDEDYTNDAPIADATILEMLQKYVYVTVNNIKAVSKVTFVIENPVTFEFNINKTDMSGNGLESAEFNVYKYLGANTVFEQNRRATGANGKIIVENNEIMEPGVYKYEITEVKPAGDQYINILDCYEDGEKYKVVVYVKLDKNGHVALVRDEAGTAFATGTKYKYEVRKVSDNSEAPSDVLEFVHKYVSADSSQRSGKDDLVNVNIVNTFEFNIDITKVNDENQPLANARFSAAMDDEVIFEDIFATAGIEHTVRNIEPGDHVFYITESKGAVIITGEDEERGSGYLNILDGKYIKVYANVTSGGVLTIQDKDGNDNANYFEIYEGKYNAISNSKLLSRANNADLYSKVNVSVGQEDNVYKLDVKVENPARNYKVTLNKKLFGDENINIKGTQFNIVSTVRGEQYQLTTDENGNISFEEECVPAGTYQYYITETDAACEEFINILEHNYVLVRLKLNEDGSIEIVDVSNETKEGKFYVLDEGRHLVSFSNTVVDEYVRVATNNKATVPELNIYVEDPQYYNFKLIKKDKDTNERMNGVRFALTVYGPNGDVVDLIDANTLEAIDTNVLITRRVGEDDGVIVVPNILVDKVGTYTFRFHEEPTGNIFDVLYKSHADDIRVQVEVSVGDRADGDGSEYIIGTPSITTGEKYVELVDVTSTMAQTVTTEVTNERIKGSYNLVINKLDKVSGQRLNNAKFSIGVVRDGQESALYKATDDVNSTEIILPMNECVVENGQIVIENIRIERPETYTIILSETEAPDGYMLLDKPIKLQVTTGTYGQYDDEEYVLKEVKLVDDENHGLVSVTKTSNEINLVAKNEYFDLALRKSITSVAYSDSDDAKITERETMDRVPLVKEDDKLFSNEARTAEYNHVKNHVRGYAEQEVIFTLRIYNEGQIDGYAEEITDHLPEGLEFVDDEYNRERGWYLDPADSTGRTVKTTYLSKNNNPNNIRFNSDDNLILALNAETGVFDHKEIEIKCKISKGVKAHTVLTNIAEISDSKANNRTAKTVDRDSHTTPGATVPDTSEGMQNYKENELTNNRNSYVQGQEDDDDFEKIIVEEFDLALRKYITAINEEEVLAGKTKDKFINKENTEDVDDEDTEDVNEEDTEDQENTESGNVAKFDREPVVNVSTLKNGASTTASYKHTKEPIEVSVGDIVTYTIEVFNEGTVDGYATLIKDDIPDGVEFVTYNEGDGSVNDIYGWKMVDENDNEVENPEDAKYIVSNYLSKDNEEVEFSNLIRAFNPNTDTALDSKYVQVQFRVVCEQDNPKIITNFAQISDDSDADGKGVKDRDSIPNEWNVDENGQNEDDQDVEHIRVTYMDLALRKFITGVIDAKTGDTQEVTDRVPDVDATKLANETKTTAEYDHTKEPVLVHTNDVVIYTLRVYNEGSKDGYATQVKDDLPKGLEFLPEHDINKYYEWSLVDEDDKPVTDIKDAKSAVTNYLSKDNETEDRQNLIVAFTRADGTKLETPAYKEVKIAFKVTEPETSDRILTNYAQISSQTDGKGEHRKDRDSIPNEWLGEDDEDFERVKVKYFDLSLRKWVTKAIVIQNGKQVVTETGHRAEDDPEDVVKVDLKKSKVNSVVVKFEYKIRVKNDGEIAGYAKEIKDYIPEGLRFDPADNPQWTQISENVIVTDEAKDIILEPGESTEVTVVLTWINSGSNLGLKVNKAEISKDYNDYDTPDIDSIPDNNKDGEDDIDDAPVMLAIKTGKVYLVYTLLVIGVGAILLVGVRYIRKMNKRLDY